MDKVVDYYLSLNSPYAYLGSLELARIARERSAEVRVKPVDLGTIFPQTGGLPLAKRAPARQAYRLVELERWSKFRNLPLTLKPKHFPFPEQTAAAAVIVAGETGGDPLALSHGILKAVWAEERDVGDVGELEQIITASGHVAADLMPLALDPATQSKREALTQEALAAGVFGSPSYVYQGQLFWGQDRLDFLERALAGG